MDIMKNFGIIGSPINHSASPYLFRAGYQGKPYTYDLIEGDVFEESYQKFLDGYDGINVTAPFKVQAFEKASWRSDECARIGATNLLVKTPEGVKAYNSDYYGILLTVLHACRTVLDPAAAIPGAGEGTSAAANGGEGIRAGKVTGYGTASSFEGLPARPTPAECQALIDGKLKTALIVGCGGAGKAAVIAALNLGLKTTLMNRSIDKAEAIAARETGLTVRPLSDFAECFGESDLVIYNIPGPIDVLDDIRTPHPKASCINPAGAQNGDASAHKKLIIEANYRNPTFDADFIAAVKVNYPDAEFVPGRHWLLYQAYAGYDLFTGESPDLTAMIATTFRL